MKIRRNYGEVYVNQEATLLLLEAQRDGRRRRITLGTDKAYDAKGLVKRHAS